MKELKQIICCLLVGLMLINPQILCTAAAEDIAPEEPEAILQMEPVHPDTSTPADTPTDTPDVPENPDVPEMPEIPDVADVAEMPVKAPVEAEAPVEAPVEADIPVDGEPDAPDDSTPEDIPAICDLSATAAVTTMEELLSAIETAQSGDSITIAYSEEIFYVDQSVTIPEGVTLYAERPLTVNEGVILTTMDNCNLYCSVTVAGTWQNNDYLHCNGGLTITSTGRIVNNGYLTITGAYESDGILTGAPFSVELYLYAHSYDELKSALMQENPDTKNVYLYASSALTITEDLTLPEKTHLTVYAENSDASLTIAEGVTFTTGHYIFQCNVPLTVAGTWVNKSNSYCDGGLTITSTGTVDSTIGFLFTSGTFVNDGTLTSNSRTRHTYSVSSVAEIRSTLEIISDGDHIEVNGNGEELVVEQDLTIPQGVYLSIQSGSGGFKIAEGVTFTTASRFNCNMPMTVAGTWLSKDISFCYEGLQITSTGRVECYSYLQIDDVYENQGTLISSSDGNAWLGLDIYSLSDLNAALAHDNPGRIVIHLRTTGDIILTEDLTIPENITLFVVDGTSITVSKDVTLTTEGRIGCSIPMTIAGTWINKADSYCHDGLTIAATGTLDNHGTIDVSGAYTVEGTVIETDGNHICVNYTVNSMEELLAVISKARSGDSIRISYSEETFYVDQSVTLPEGVAIHVDRPLVVNEGVTLTSMPNSNFYYPVTIAGTWLCKGYSHCNGLTITATGCVENNSYLQINNSYENQGTLTTEPGATTRLVLYAYSLTELKAAFEYENPDETWINFYASDKLVLTEDLTTPADVYLMVYAQEPGASLTVAEGVTLTTSHYFDCHIPLTVAGTWDNRHGSYCYDGLTITSTGVVDCTGGWLHIYGAAVNDGTLINGSNVSQTSSVTTLDELKAALNQPFVDTVHVSGDGGDFVIDEPLMIPAGVVVEVYQNIQNLRINTELTIDAGATLRSEVPIMAEGTIYNYGAIGARNGLSVTGTIHNYAYIRVNGALTGEARIVDYEAASRSVYQAYTVDSESALRDVLGSLDGEKWNDIFVPNGLTLTEDTTIPAGVYLEIQSGTFTVGDDATLITNDNLCVKGDMVVDGYWENYHANYDMCCILYGDLTTKSVITNSGHLELYQYCQAMKDGMIDNSAGGTIGCGTNIASLDELYSIVEGKSYLSIAVSVNEACTLTLDRDLTIPDGMRLYMWDVDLVVPEGVTFTVGDSTVYLNSIDVAGTLINNSSFDSETINVSGTVENNYVMSFGTMTVSETGHVKNTGLFIGAIENLGTVETGSEEREPRHFSFSLRSSCDWNDIFANAQSGDSFYCNSCSENAWITISADTVVPEDITISGGRYKVAEGAVFVTNGTNFSAYEMQVDGSWSNHGSVDADRLTVNGIVHNFGQITSSTVTGTENVMGNAVTPPIIDTIYVTIPELFNALSTAESGTTVLCYHLGYGNVDSTIINRDIVVPEGVTLVFSGVSKVYLTAGHTLTVNGSLLMPQQLYIAGKLVVNGSITIDADGNGSYYWDYYGMTLGGIQITDSGTYDIKGSIRVAKWDYSGQSVTDPRAALTGMETASLSVQETERYWYLSPDKGAVLCTVENDGCTLRLLDGDDCLWQSASVTDGAVLAGVTPGQYTLDASRPGYVTRRYTVDTTAATSLSVQLVATGNINGAAVNGCDVEITDLACLYHYLTTNDRTESQIEDEAYFMAMADVNGDSAVDVYDLQRLYEHVSGVNRL